jgi:hypothetical protein
MAYIPRTRPPRVGDGEEKLAEEEHEVQEDEPEHGAGELFQGRAGEHHPLGVGAGGHRREGEADHLEVALRTPR